MISEAAYQGKIPRPGNGLAVIVFAETEIEYEQKEKIFQDSCSVIFINEGEEQRNQEEGSYHEIERIDRIR